MSNGRATSAVIAAPGHALVRASAGTGKTYGLTLRYLALLAAGAEPASILATTFTRKAAGEILQRVMGRLAGAVLDDAQAGKLQTEIAEELGTTVRVGSSDAAAMLERLSRQLHRAAIGTIDSFLYRTAMSFRHELGLPRGIQPVDERDAAVRQLRLDAIAGMLEDETLQLLVELLRRLHHDQAKRSVTASFEQIVGELAGAYADAPDAEMWRTIPSPSQGLDRVALAEYVVRMQEVIEAVPSDKRFHTAHQKAREAAEQGNWESFLGTGIVNALTGSGTYGGKSIPAPVASVYTPLIEYAKGEVLRRAAAQTVAMHELMTRFDARFRQLQAEHGLLLFDDFSRRLAAAHAQGALELMEMYYRLDARVAHLLLDEFQDTSLAQWAVLEPMAQEIAAQADGTRSLFCVGDVKQSIYAWRGGCPELFLQLPDRLHLGDEAIGHLEKSYRSSPVVIEAVNRVFSHLGDVGKLVDEHEAVAAAWAAQFQTHETARTDLPGYVELRSSCPGQIDEQTHADGEQDDGGDWADGGDVGDNGDIPRPADAHLAWCAQRVADLARLAPGKTIGVLTRSNKPAATLLDCLRRADCDASGEGGQSLTDDPAVNLVLSALRLADHPGHTAAAYHVLCSPLAAVVGLRSRNREDCEAAAARIRAVVLDEGYGQVVTAWARALGPHGDSRSAARLTQLIALVDEREQAAGGGMRPGELVAAIEQARVEEPTPARVRVMTIHAAKGLEFDIVVLPELDRPLPGKGETCWLVRDEPTGPVREVHARANEVVRKQSTQLKHAYQQHVSQLLRDELCALYVAMTRARQGLYMFVKPMAGKKDGQPRSRGLRVSAVLVNTLSDVEEQAAVSQVLYLAGDANWLGAAESTMTADASNASEIAGAAREATARPLRVVMEGDDVASGESTAWRSWRRTSPSSLEGGAKIAAAELLELDVSEPRQRGRVIHAFFERVGDLGGAAGPWGGEPTEADLRQLAQRMMPHQPSDWRDERLRDFARMLERPAVRAALTLPAPAAGCTLDLWRERPFAVRRKDELLTGLFDRVVIEQDAAGKARGAALIDFKTDRLGERHEYLDAAVARYRPQIEAYRQALAALLGLEQSRIAATLLFVEAGIAVDVRPGDACERRS
jgi:ATP-dependent helicase/nuclease subunit A